jgi:hypothetical protein
VLRHACTVEFAAQAWRNCGVIGSLALCATGPMARYDWVLDNQRRLTYLLCTEIPRCAWLSHADCLRDCPELSAEYPVDQVC